MTARMGENEYFHPDIIIERCEITDLRKFFRELFGLFLIFIAILLFLGILSFNANDPSFNLVHSGKQEIQNLAGLFGAYTSGFLNDIMGICALLWPIVFAFLGVAYLSSRYVMYWWRWCGLFLLTICTLVFTSAFDLSLGDLSGGGMVGDTLYKNGLQFLSPVGTFIIWLFLFLIGLQLLFNFSWTNLITLVYQWVADKFFSPAFKEKLATIFKKFSALKLSLPSKEKTFRTLPRSASLSAIKAFFQKQLAKIPKRVPTPSSIPEIKLPEPASEPHMPLSEASHPDIRIVPAPPVMEDIVPEDGEMDEADLSTEEVQIYKETYEDTPEKEWKLENANEPDTGIRLFSEKPSIHPLPPTSLLTPAPPVPPASMELLKARGQDLMACFNDFGIQGELVRITPGPVITMFEVRPAAGVRVSKIMNLCDDLSLALKAVSVRIQPVPGSNTVGIEIPNDSRETVNFRELVEAPEFRDNTGALTIILGKTISGQPYCTDLAKMPHLLVGGTTGAGKSVSLNAMLISLLYQHQPSDLKLLLVDPKRVEMAVYADLPHLVHPVVTEMDDAKSALEWAIHEMQRRFDTMQRINVRNVATYNKRLAEFKDNLPPDFADLKPIPHLVIVIDELADLMMTAAREVESSILRLLQLARAAAIHLILATQRPSVDVVTGLLKANLNCRVAFKVISRHDSRTILDQTGAEQLLGKGDMLFKPPAGALQRLHAPFLSDEEIQAVVNYWKSRENPVYDINFARWNLEKPSSSASSPGDVSDALYEEAKTFVMEQGKGSISLLQRHLKIGFNRAARIMEQMEKDGIITPPDGSKPRTVIRG